MSRMVSLMNMISPWLEVPAPFFDQGWVSVCGDALYVRKRKVEKETTVAYNYTHTHNLLRPAAELKGQLKLFY
jgi:hypothetical protein